MAAFCQRHVRPECRAEVAARTPTFGAAAASASFVPPAALFEADGRTVARSRAASQKSVESTGAGGSGSTASVAAEDSLYPIAPAPAPVAATAAMPNGSLASAKTPA